MTNWLKELANRVISHVIGGLILILVGFALVGLLGMTPVHP